MLFLGLSVSPLRFAWLKFSLLALALVSLLLPAAVSAQQTFTCSTEGGSNCALQLGSSQTSSSSSSFTVPNTAGTIKTISIELNGVWSLTNSSNFFSMQQTSFLLTGPGGEFELLGATGDGADGADDTGNFNDPANGLHGLNIIVQDGASAAPMGCGDACSSGETNAWPAGNGTATGNTTGNLGSAGSTNDTVRPGSYFGYDPSKLENPPPLGVLGDWPDTDGCNPDPIIGNNGSYNNAVNCSSPPTLTSKYATTNANGTWTLTAINGNGVTSPISITNWSLTFTYATAVGTTTVLSSNANPSNAAGTTIFTAAVSSSGGTPTGTVTFTSNSAAISGCTGKALSGGEATCSATLGQGNNIIEASYTPSGSFGASSASMTQLVEVTPIQSGNKWCNGAQIVAPGNTAGVQYPAVIHVSGYQAGATVGGNLTVELQNATGPSGVNAYHLLVAPGAQNLDFFDSTFADEQPSSPVNLTIFDDAGQTPSGSSAPSTGNYDPYDNSGNGSANALEFDTFPSSVSPSIDSSIPQVPGTINRAAPLGGTSLKTFQQAFSGAPANGDWALYAYAGGGENETIESGWCITLDVNTGVGTTTSVTSSSNPQTTGQPVTLTATVVVQGTSTPANAGTVTFLDNNAVPAGVSSNTVAVNGSGQASITTSSLAEGDHSFTATYNGTSSYNGSFGTFVQRINDATTLYANGATISHGPTCGATYCDCNGGPISANASFKGAFTPNPSVISVTDLPGTISSVTLGLNQYSSAATILYALESMVVGPTGADLDFFSNVGGTEDGGTVQGGTAQLGNYIFSDAASNVISDSVTTLSPGTYKPASFPEEDPNWPEPAQPYTASSSGFYTLPASITYAASRGSGTFSGQFENTNPNGNWALYMTEDDSAGVASAANGWCVNLTVTPPVIAKPSLSHVGSFAQGESNAQYEVSITNNGPGSTGDPTGGSQPMTVTDTLNAAFTYASGSGTGWSCSASGQVVTCKNDSAIAESNSYPELTINVNVSGTASGNITNQIAAAGAGVSSVNSNIDTVTIDVAPVFTSVNNATFKVGTASSFVVTASGTPAPTFSETGALPSGVTLTNTGTLSGTPAAGTGGTYPITITAANGSTNATQTFTLTVDQSPAITSANSTTFATGAAGSFTVTASGYPAAMFSETGTLPTGVTLSSAGLLSGTPAAGSGGTYTFTITAANGSTNATQAFTLTVDQAPVFTSANSATFTVGSAGSFTVTASGNPAPTFTETGALPTGVTLSSAGLLSGTPAAGSGGTYTFTITAANGSTNATQTFTLTVDQAPSITSVSSTTFTAGTAGTFTVMASGYPAATFSETGALPTGITFTNTGILTGTPIAGTGGTYVIVINASNGVSPVSVQTFTLTVNQAPVITSANNTTFTVGTAGTFSVTTTGFPTATLSETGALPSGVTLVNNGNGTATLAGTPAAGSGGAYTFTITANNGVSPNATQTFTLTVDQAPAITSANNTNFAAGISGTFTVTASGYPAATFSETGVLPTGVTFTNTGILTGMPIAGTGGTYVIVIDASNGVSPVSVQTFTLTVNQAPAITSANNATFTAGAPGTFTVTASGSPAPTFSETGALPSGVTLSSAGLLAGTPAAGSGGTYTFTITANNGVSPNATQTFTLTVDQAPAITSANNTTFPVSTLSTFTLTTTGFPTATLSETGTLPSGVTFANNGNGTATLAGTPPAGTGGTYNITVTAQNGVSPNATQSFTLTVTQTTATITLSNLSQTYTGTPLSATATTNPAGLTVGLTYNGSSTTAPTAAGSYAVVATVNSPGYTGTASGTLVIAKALLMVTANNASMAPGASVPALTASYSGFVPGDTVTVLSGSPAFSTTATSSSPLGNYPITVTQGTLAAANYTFTFVNGTLSVVQAPTVVLITTATLTGSASAGYTATVTVTNNGTGTASNVQLNSATLGAATGSPLPQSLGAIAAGGGSATVTVNFPGTAGTDGARAAETYAGTSSGGTFSASIRAVLP